MEENTSQSQEPAETTTTQAASPTLEELSQEFSVEEQVSNFQAQPEQRYAQQQSWTPDPISDPEAFNQYAKSQADSLNTLSQTVKSLTDKIQSYEQQTVQQKIDADVERAVSHVNEKLGVDPMLAEIALEKMYRTDTNFKKIWDNRDKNPGAFNKALDVIADKLTPIFSVKQDPQLTENQLAAKKSQQTMANAPPQEKHAEWDNLSEAEFEAKWAAFKRG